MAFLLLSAAFAQIEPSCLADAALRLRITPSKDGPFLSWEGSSATLEQSSRLGGGWSEVVGAVSPYRLSSASTISFFRLRSILVPAQVRAEIDDPTTPEEDFRPVPFGIFRTLSPRMRLLSTLGNDPLEGEFQVVVDDGDDTTDDDLDISGFFQFANGAAVADLPECLPVNSMPAVARLSRRDLSEDASQIRVLYLGENRLRFIQSGQECFSACFLSYDAFDRTVVGGAEGSEPMPDQPGVAMMVNHIMLDFDRAATDAEISRFLHDEHLRPQGIARDLGVVQARPMEPLHDALLLKRIGEVNSALAPERGGARPDITTSKPSIAGEVYTQAFNKDFENQANTGAWNVLAPTDHQQHWAMQTFPAHRLIDILRPKDAKVRTLLAGDFGPGGDFSGAAADELNSYFVQGRRIFNATRVDPKGKTIPNDKGEDKPGDLRNVKDEYDPPRGHDTAVVALMLGDGVGCKRAKRPDDPACDSKDGVERKLEQIVLGTGKDGELRPIKFQIDELSYYKMLELSALDKSVSIHLIELSHNSKTKLDKKVVENLVERYASVATSGKLIVGPAWNEGAEGGKVGDCDSGRIGASHATPRKDIPDAQGFRRNVLVVGATTGFGIPGNLEMKGPGSNPGAEISVVASGVTLSVQPDGQLNYYPGTSFSAPLVAGIAAELMLVDPALKQKENIVKVAEYIEATADDIDAPGRENRTGNGRVNFWKAALSAANGGLSDQSGRTALGGEGKDKGNDSFFKYLPLLNDEATRWYGFEVRTRVQNAVLWFKDSKNQYQKLADEKQSRPAVRGADLKDILCYVSTQPRRIKARIASGEIYDTDAKTIHIALPKGASIAAANLLAGGTVELLKANETSLGSFTVAANTTTDRDGFGSLTLGENAPKEAKLFRNLLSVPRLLPPLPFSKDELKDAELPQQFLGVFSVPRADLLDKTELLATQPGKTPTDDGAVLFTLPIGDLAELRKAQDATKAEIKALVAEFDDFVFHVIQE
ncbi:MAG: S8 family serine peptidase [Verrucomicrobia bacterium]|nr:S8 family serine peptidase [Verrucomicrobiota bacterium]